MTEKTQQWYAVYTRPRWEKKLAKVLEAKGIEHYCPLNKVHKAWSDRKKIVLEPLFKGYLFVRTEPEHKWDLRKIDGIVNYVHWLGRPAVIRDADIDTIKKFLQEFDGVEVVEQQIAPRDTVVIKQGVLMDYKGIVLEVNGNTATVIIEGLGVELKAVFKKANLHLLKAI